jgi:hypothetical protein
LTVKCGGNVHGKGVVEITASNVFNSKTAPRNVADLGTYSEFWSADKPGQWICEDFQALRIDPTRYTVRAFYRTPNYAHVKSWAVEGSDDGASWREIDRRENNSDLNDEDAVKTFAVAQPGSFHRIRLRQTAPNHYNNNCLIFIVFEVFGAVAGLQ